MVSHQHWQAFPRCAEMRWGDWTQGAMKCFCQEFLPTFPSHFAVQVQPQKRKQMIALKNHSKMSKHIQLCRGLFLHQTPKSPATPQLLIGSIAEAGGVAARSARAGTAGAGAGAGCAGATWITGNANWRV